MKTISTSDFASSHTDKYSKKRKSHIKLNNVKKNILLIGPQSDLIDAERSFMAPALGVIRLAGYLNKNGHHASHFEPNLPMLTGKGKKIEEVLQEKKWDIIGFSILEETMINDMQTMKLAEKYNPHSLIVAGGIEAQFNYQTVLDKTPCNIVVISEGEKSLLSIANGVSLHEIPGIVFKNNSIPLDEETFNFATSAIEWEELPYEEYWDYYLKKYGNKITEQNKQEIHTVRVFSRNRCPIGCKFCSSTNQITWGSDQKVPVISATGDTLIHNIKRIIESHPRTRTIYLTDDDFCINKKDVIRFCKKIIEAKFKNITFMSFCRASDATDEMLSWMKKANFRRLNFGIESFSEKVLKEMGKRCTPKENHEALKLAKKHNIPAFMNMIMTTPESTLDDVQKSIDGAMQYAKDKFYHAGVTISVKPLKGTDYYETFTDYMTRVIKVPDTNYHLKIDEMIYAKDPKVKLLQQRYWNEIDDFIEEEKRKSEITHGTAANMAILKLSLIQKLLNEIKDIKNIDNMSYNLSPKSMPINERQTVDVDEDNKMTINNLKKNIKKSKKERSTHGHW
ncbi:B12-binding domain-containing radical SAM protein [Candidatus Pelagibacter sp.]|nr:B12-binding domain-containing radical SAM protein [Candidatus Pelagibacter sp.]